MSASRPPAPNFDGTQPQPQQQEQEPLDSPPAYCFNSGAAISSPPQQSYQQQHIMSSYRQTPSSNVDNSHQYDHDHGIMGNLISFAASSMKNDRSSPNTPSRSVGGFIEGFITSKTTGRKKKGGLLSTVRQMGSDLIIQPPKNQREQYEGSKQRYYRQQQQMQQQQIQQQDGYAGQAEQAWFVQHRR